MAGCPLKHWDFWPPTGSSHAAEDSQMKKKKKHQKWSPKFLSPLQSKAFLSVAFICLRVLSIQADQGKLQISKSADFQELKVECSERCLSFL